MDTKPWYRQFWPWFIMALPASVVVAGLGTVYIAVTGADDLVATDYYKNGLEINVELDKKQRALELGMQSTLTIIGTRINVHLTGNTLPAAMALALSHPMEADKDIQLKLAQTAPGVYEGQLPQSLEHRWHWQLEPLAQDQESPWRLDGEFTITKP
jgi:hypothetical protein